MSAGYQQIVDRLAGCSESAPEAVGSSLDTLRLALESYLFRSCTDEISRANNWETFVIPSLLLVLHDHLSNDSIRIRCNEYFFCEMATQISSVPVQEHAVLGALAGLVDAGSVPNHELSVEDLRSLFYDLFPGLESYLSEFSPVGPFIPHVVDLSRLALFLVSISVSYIILMF